MEQIIAKLLVSNSKVIQEGTKELKEAFKSPEAIPALCDVIVTSQNAQIRQSAAVLLRRKLGKKRLWSKIDIGIRNRIKEGMIQALVKEQDKLVKNGIAQFIGLIGKYEIADNSWPELLNFVFDLLRSDNIYDKELGMYTLSIMTEMSQGSYITRANDLAVYFNGILNGLQDTSCNLAYYTVLTMNNLVGIIGGHQQMINVYHGLLPRILEIINAFTTIDEKKAVDLFGILEELIEFAIAVIVPHVKIVVEMCLQIGRNNTLPTAVQIKAINVIGWLIRSKGKVIQKNNLVEPVIDVLMLLMAQEPEEDGNEEYFVGDPDQFTTITIATQTLDLIALHIPAEKTVPYILTKVEPAIQSNNVYSQKAAYLCLAVLAEGCSECIRHKYLQSFLKCVCNALQNQNTIVQNAAFFALGQFAEHLQPEISQFASELLPVLFEYLNQLHTQMQRDKTEPSSLDKLFYALETFCENLDDELLPYLPMLMERLMVGLDPSGWSLQLKKVALSTLGAATTAVKTGMLPYFPKIIEILNLYINADSESDIYQLQSDAIDCLAVVAHYIGNEHFGPLVQDTLQLALRILDGTNDPDIRRSVYALLGALATIIKEEISPVLPKIVEQMIQSIQSSEGIISYHDEEEKEDVENLFDISSEDDNDYEEDIASTSSEDSTNCRYSVENSYNDEKEQACLTLKEISANAGLCFLPYLEKSFEEIYKLIDYPQENIRKTALDSLLQFCITLHQIKTDETKVALHKGLQVFIPKCAEIIRTDEERNVVINGLESYALLLKEIKGEALVGEGHREAIMNCVIDVLTQKTMCQDTDLGHAGLENSEDTTDAEHDELLLESACDVIPRFGDSITPDDFMLYFPNILQLLRMRAMKQHSISQRSFAFGTLAECMKSLSVFVEKFVPQLLQLWLTGLKDSGGEVRNNAIFGLGEMVRHGKDKIFRYYPDILQALSAAVSKEIHAGSLDNICGALAKMIVENPSLIPLDQVFPAFLQHLPLKDDFEENEAVVKSFLVLYQKGENILKEHLDGVIKVLAHIFVKNQCPNDETKELLTNLIKMIQKDFTIEFNKSVSQFDASSAELLATLLSQ